MASLEAYDKGYIWASEPVIVAIRDLTEALEHKAVVDTQLKRVSGAGATMLLAESQRLDTAARSLYQRCMLEMRKDSGCTDSTAEYRVITFG